MVAMTQMSTPSPQPSASTPIRVGPHELSVVGVVAVSRTATTPTTDSSWGPTRIGVEALGCGDGVDI